MPVDLPISLRADARANRDAIVEAAARLYAERSPVVPMAEIAKEAGVGRATLARRFPTPDSLRVAVLTQLVEALEETAAGVPDGPEALETLLPRILRQLQENAPLVDFIRAAPGQVPDAEPVMERIPALLRGPVRRAHEAGLIPPEVAAEDIRLVLFMASAAIRSFPDPGDSERVLRLCRRAIGMTPGATR